MPISIHDDDHPGYFSDSIENFIERVNVSRNIGQLDFAFDDCNYLDYVVTELLGGNDGKEGIEFEDPDEVEKVKAAGINMIIDGFSVKFDFGNGMVV